MEAREFLNQKRIGLVNKFYYQVLVYFATGI